MNKINYFIFIKFIVIAVYVLLLFEIIFLSREVRFEDVETTEKDFTVDVEFDFCYPLGLDNQTHCFILNDQSTDGQEEEEKIDWNHCDFKRPIACCTKNLKKPNEIIQNFEESKIKSSIQVRNVMNKPQSDEVTHQLHFGQLCEKHLFTDLKPEEVNFEINSNNSQSFDIYLSFARKFENGSDYLSLRRHMLRRNCWWTQKKDQTSLCLETDKIFDFEITYFSTRYLEKPYVTNCVIEGNFSTQNDCYDECVKKYEKNYYLLTYNKEDNDDLTINDYQSMEHSIRTCSDQCNRPHCYTTQFYSEAIKETNFNRPSDNQSDNIQGLIRIKAKNPNFGIDAIPIVGNSKFIWMILISVEVFFGIDIYGIFMRSTKMYSQLDDKKIRIKKKSHKKVIFAAFILSISFGLAILCEKMLFNFGTDEDTFKRRYLSEIESLKERNVSVSVCFDLCDILRVPNESCNNETLSKESLENLDKMTQDAADFKKRSSLKNNIKYVPIRQAEKEIPTFFRGLKKCFLIAYVSTNVCPHIALQRKSMIHLTITKWKVAHFYIEDGNGFSFPKIKTPFVNKSVLHKVEIQLDKNLDNCTQYSKESNNSYLTTRDDHVQNCIIEKSVEKGFLPSLVNLKFYENNTLQEYYDLPFGNDSDLERRFLNECEERFQKECSATVTSLTDYELLEERIGNDPNDLNAKYIVINLTPFLFEKKYFVRENAFIVIHRVLSFLTLFTCFSVTEIFKNLIASYLYGLASLFDFRFVQKLSVVIVFLIFLFHYAFLLCWITTSITTTFSTEIVKKIEFPRFRLCYEHQNVNVSKFIDWDEFDGPNAIILDDSTLKLNQLIKKIVIYNVDKSQEIMSAEAILNSSTSFYLDDLKCFNFDIKKTYDANNPMVPKLEKLLEFHIDLQVLDELIVSQFHGPDSAEKKLNKTRVFLFLSDLYAVYFDANQPYQKEDTTIYYIEKVILNEDDYWNFKNPIAAMKESFGINEASKHHYANYMDELSKDFATDQYTTTTNVLLHTRETKGDFRSDLPIRNRKFNSYIWFRSISTNKNYLDYLDDRNVKSFYGAFFRENKSRKNLLRLSLRPNLIRIITRYKNTYTIMELFLHTMALTKLYFKFNFIELPEIAERTWPLIKFAVFLFLYCVVIFLLYLFNCWFKLMNYLEIKSQ